MLDVKGENIYKMDSVPIGGDIYAIAIQRIEERDITLKVVRPDGAINERKIGEVDKLIKLIGFDNRLAMGYQDIEGHGVIEFINPQGLREKKDKLRGH